MAPTEAVTQCASYCSKTSLVQAGCSRSWVHNVPDDRCSTRKGCDVITSMHFPFYLGFSLTACKISIRVFSTDTEVQVINAQPKTKTKSAK